jgi:murein L,D-transpeptidase YcbB/YkuD
MKFILIIAFICVLKVFGSCKNNTQIEIVKTNTSINVTNSFNTLFLDSVQLSIFLKEHNFLKKFSNQFFDFYKSRNYQYAWFDSSGYTQQASNFMNLLQTTVEALQDSSLYINEFNKIQQKFQQEKPSFTKEEILHTELNLTGQFFLYAIKVYKGSNINADELGWYIPRKKIDLKKILLSTLESDSVAQQHYAPVNPTYFRLQAALPFYHELVKKEKWNRIFIPKKSLKKGDTSFIIPLIKHRLKIIGDAAAANTSKTYDSSLLIAVKSFQQRMGLEINGIINKATIEELNVSPEKRIQQILINLERIRWMPAQLDSNFVVINIPEYKLHLIENGKEVFDMDVIVGTTANNTVIFNGSIKFIVFSPYWNVPQSITIKELLPSIRKNPDYLETKNMEITSYQNGIPIVRQKPGNDNALGGVKFLFPNSHSIYLHDTPFKNLFSRSTRSFSHGCIRIAEAKKFAQYLLRNDTATIWKSEVIDSCMQLAKEKWVPLKKPIPVAIVYFTAWVNQAGQLNFRKDIYKHDEKLAAKLFVQ